MRHDKEIIHHQRSQINGLYCDLHRKQSELYKWRAFCFLLIVIIFIILMVNLLRPTTNSTIWRVDATTVQSLGVSTWRI